MNFTNFFIHNFSSLKHKNLLKFPFFIGSLIFIITCGIHSMIFAAENKNFEERFKKLSNELRCPTCQGLSVKDSEAGFSTSIKGKISELLKQGNSDEEIKAYFVERYGEWILRAPPLSGFNILLWVLPVATIITGLSWVIYRSKKLIEKPTNEITELTPEEEQKIIDDLSRFEKS